jgi:chorismate synthase
MRGMGSTWGTLFKVSSWGESHGPSIGVVVDGCPPRIPVQKEWIQRELERRRPGQSAVSTQRQESDEVEILSGVVDGLSTGTPMAFMVRNQDARGRDYQDMHQAYRPSHADYTYQAKYGIRSVEGGGRSSARETIARVVAGAVAKKVLADWYGVQVVAFVRQVGGHIAPIDAMAVQPHDVEANPVRCPHPASAETMLNMIKEARKAGDSLGGVVECVAHGVPAGWGEPVFDKLDADLAKAMLSLPACKGFEVGSGFAGVLMTGSQHNDAFYNDQGRIRTRTNHSGGIQGGISNGEPIVLRAAFKPTATIMREQETVDQAGESVSLMGRGRHDPCVLPRAVPIVESMVAIVLLDHALRQRARMGA